MSDQPPSQRPRPRQAHPQSLSRESRFIGFVVLGFGILAVVAILLMAFGGEEGVQTAQQEQLQEELSAAASPTPSGEEKEEEKLFLKREKSVDIDDMQGGWQAMIGEYLTVLQIQKNAFQIIMALPDPQMPRKYYTGTYKIVDDMIVMEPQPKWGAPKKPEDAKFIYKRLTTSSFPMIVGFKDGNMVWQTVPQSEKRMYVPPRSPLLAQSKQNYIIWKKTK